MDINTRTHLSQYPGPIVQWYGTSQTPVECVSCSTADIWLSMATLTYKYYYQQSPRKRPCWNMTIWYSLGIRWWQHSGPLSCGPSFMTVNPPQKQLAHIGAMILFHLSYMHFYMCYWHHSLLPETAQEAEKMPKNRLSTDHAVPLFLPLLKCPYQKGPEWNYFTCFMCCTNIFLI